MSHCLEVGKKIRRITYFCCLPAADVLKLIWSEPGALEPDTGTLTALAQSGEVHQGCVAPTLDIEDDVPLPEHGPDVVLQHRGRELRVGGTEPGHELAGPGELSPVGPGLASPGDQLVHTVRSLVVVVLLLDVVVQFVYLAGAEMAS